MDLDDIGVIEPGDRLGLEQHPCPGLGPQDAFAEELDSHATVEQPIVGPVDLAHSPLPEQFSELVAAVEEDDLVCFGHCRAGRMFRPPGAAVEGRSWKAETRFRAPSNGLLAPVHVFSIWK